MTVENQTYKVVAEGNGSGFSFSFSPMVLPTDEDDLEVTLTDADGADTTLTRGSGASNYSVSVSSFPGTGSITYPADSSTALPSGQYLTMKRVLVLEQTQDIENQGGYSPETLETTLDKLVMIALQQQEELDFSFKVSLQDSTAIGRLPNAATRASKYLFFDSSGDPTAVSSINNTAVSAFVETIIDDTSAAEVRTTIGAQEDVVTTRGDLVYGDSSGVAARLALGTTGFVPLSDGTDVAWGQVDTAGIADNAVTQDKMADDAVGLAELAAGTDGELITWDSSGDPAAVAVGTATHVLTSNGAGAAPTFQAIPSSGGYTELEDSGVLSATNLYTFDSDVVNVSNYTRFRVVINAYSSTSTGELFALLQDGGSNETTNYIAGASTAGTGLNYHTQRINLMKDTLGAAGVVYGYLDLIYDPGTDLVFIDGWSGNSTSSVGEIGGVYHGGFGTAFDGITISTTSGNFDGGTQFVLFGAP